MTGLQSRVLHGCRNKVTNSPCSPAAFRSDRGTHSAVSGCHELGRWRNPEAGNRSVPSQQGAEGRGFSPAMGNGQNRRGFGRWGSRELLLRKMNEPGMSMKTKDGAIWSAAAQLAEPPPLSWRLGDSGALWDFRVRKAAASLPHSKIAENKRTNRECL